ncbi:hypothetical protein IT568_12005 [bacterium]|nr:hypothetical protein [bacterium]
MESVSLLGEALTETFAESTLLSGVYAKPKKIPLILKIPKIRVQTKVRALTSFEREFRFQRKTRKKSCGIHAF